MMTIPKLPSPAGFLEKASTGNKAIMGGALLGYNGFNTILLALVASLGIGEMPDMLELQDALVQVIAAVGGGLLVYLVPNYADINPAANITIEKAK